ncbi:MAG: catechol-2,3-dioxygenase [Sulfitobacter sp.]|jgi:catechol-2,3-dioxygenase
MPKVFELGYVALGTADLARTKDYYVNTLGTREVDSDAEGNHYLSIGYHHHDIILTPSDAGGLLRTGYQLCPDVDVVDFAKTLKDHGLTPKHRSDSQPGVKGLIEVDVAGHIHHFYDSIETPAPGFNTSGISPLSLGHVALVSPDAEKLVTFYSEILGFYTTDWIEGLATFMTCSAEHHVINIIKAPPSMVHHIAYQLRESAAHVLAADKLTAAGIDTKWGPSRHTAGHNLAAYHKDPDNVMIELYSDMDVFIPELGICAPRPWHEHMPMRPRQWDPAQLSAWNVDFAFDLARG